MHVGRRDGREITTAHSCRRVKYSSGNTQQAYTHDRQIKIIREYHLPPLHSRRNLTHQYAEERRERDVATGQEKRGSVTLPPRFLQRKGCIRCSVTRSASRDSSFQK